MAVCRQHISRSSAREPSRCTSSSSFAGAKEKKKTSGQKGSVHDQHVCGQYAALLACMYPLCFERAVLLNDLEKRKCDGCNYAAASKGQKPRTTAVE